MVEKWVLNDEKKFTGTPLFKPFGTILFFLLCLSILCQAEYLVKIGDFTKTIILSGSLQAQKAERFIVPRSNTWQVQIKWMAGEGDYVNPGDTVVRFDTSNLVSEIENLEMSLQVKKEQRTQKSVERNHKKLELEVQLKQAEIEYKKSQLDASVPKGIFSDYEYDRKQLEMQKSAKALKKAELEKLVKTAAMLTEIKKIEIEIEEGKIKIQKHQDILNRLTLKAKKAGSVVYGIHRWQRRKIQVGDSVPSSWTIASIPDNNSLQVEAWVNETDINRIKPGQKVDLVADAYPDRKFTGFIKAVLNNAEKRDKWGKAHYFWVLIELDSRDLEIMKPGMSVKCMVRAAVHKQVLLIPIGAAYFDGQDFRVKPVGGEVILLKPIGFNEFYLAVSKNMKVKVGNILENPGQVEIDRKNKGK